MPSHMTTPVIQVKDLTKTFRVSKKFPGFWGGVKSLLTSQYEVVEAVHQLNLTVNEAEKVAFIGLNGAGKSTTIKMLTGILYPTSGTINVLGLVPWKDRKALGYQIGTIFGQRTQFWHHLPALDTFNLLSKVFDLDQKFYKRQCEELVSLFEIGDIIHKPVRQLSLGQRMRCEIVASLLHNPKILFLDEPTIGLDIYAKLKIRELLNTISKRHGTTLFLTSHDTADIDHVCDRVIVLDKGHILRDCSLNELKQSFKNRKIVKFDLIDKGKDFSIPDIKIIDCNDHLLICEIDPQKMGVNQMIQEVAKFTNFKDVAIENPSMDEIIRTLYANELES